jgi:hypothetical protein
MSGSFKNQRITTTKRESKMKKTLLALLSAALLITVVQPAQAEDQKVLAIIDTAINSDKHPAVIYEACFTYSNSTGCSNGKTFMEGKNSASAPWPSAMNNLTYHGDMMVKAALLSNPDIKIVFVRYSDVSQLGNSLNTVEALVKAIDWVSKNAEKYSIDAVSISQSSISTGNLSRCTTDKNVINAIASMNAKNIPTFAATGNDGSKTVVGFPSCVPGVIGVGALGNATQLEKATNTGPGLDMVAPGKVTITKYNGSPTDTAGSSIATALSSASYVNRNTFKTFQEYLNSLSKILIGNVSYISN